MNENFRKNGGQDEIIYSMNRDVERMLLVTAEIRGREKKSEPAGIADGEGHARRFYMLSLLETYAEGADRVPQHCDGGGAGDFPASEAAKGIG